MACEATLIRDLARQLFHFRLIGLLAQQLTRLAHVTSVLKSLRSGVDKFCLLEDLCQARGKLLRTALLLAVNLDCGRLVRRLLRLSNQLDFRRVRIAQGLKHLPDQRLWIR